VEGPSDDPAIVAVRERQKRNFLATLLLSQGVPMISGGDELGRTQNGNNNAYAQDNEISWFRWDLDERKKSLLEFTRKLVNIRRSHPNLHRRKFFQDRPIDPGTPLRQVDGHTEKDITWLGSDGGEMSADQWNAGWMRCIGLMLNGRTLEDVNAVGEAIRDDTFLILLNAHVEAVEFRLPSDPGVSWEVVFDTAAPAESAGRIVSAGKLYELQPRSTALLRERSEA
jgi:glycogen operon protein